MVLFVSHSGALGGAERLLLQFAPALDGELALAAFEGELGDAARAAGLRVFPLTERRPNIRASVRDRVLAPARLAAYALELRTMIRDLDPELVLAWGMRPAIACLLGPRLRCPIAFQQNDLLPGPIIARLVRAACARADLVTVPSRTVARDLDPRGRLGGRLRTVRPGIELERYAVDQMPAEPPEVVVLGAIAERKRLDVALEAFALARRERPDLRLRVLGAPFPADGDRLWNALRERAAKPDLAGGVEFVGAVADPRPELGRASCLLHCAWHEAFGLAVLEALAVGRPAIVPDAGGPAEIVDRSCGRLYPAGDHRAAAAAIVELLSDPRRTRELGAAGRERARMFDASRARLRYAEAVEPLRSRRRSLSSPLALVTVTHNSAAHLRALLASAARHLPHAQVVVVDSGSSDESVEVARASGAATISLDRNLGFGRASNLGLAEVREPVAALVNPDVELLDQSLLLLASEAMRRDRPERLLAPLVLSPDGSRQDTVHPLPGSPAELARSLIPPGALPGPLGVPLSPWRSARPRRVGWAVGCALVARTETLRRLGPFDERIFLYGEDLDLGLRAAAAGVETWFWPGGRVLHHGAHSTHRAFGGEPYELLARARHQALARVCGPRRAALDDAAQAVTFASRLALKRALCRSAGRERRQLAALRSARREDGRT